MRKPGLTVLLLAGFLAPLLAYQACGEFKTIPLDVSSLSQVAGQKDCGGSYSPGHTMIHRLSNEEYNNTVRDLLFTTTRPGDQFASSPSSSTGFSNESSSLAITNQTVADFAAAAQTLADEVIASKSQGSAGSYAKLALCAAQASAQGSTPDADCARSVVTDLGQRAFRRPLELDDETALMSVYSAGGSFDVGFHDVIVAVLIDPRFLMTYVRHHSPDDPNAIAVLDDYELASRLSYFLWQSMPDGALFTRAQAGTLHEPDVLRTEVKRMLASPKAQSMATTFRREWAHLSQLEGNTTIGGLNATTISDISKETQLFIEDIIQSDASVLNLVNGDKTFVNQNLANFYGWTVPTATSSQFVKVSIPDADRRGILTQAATMLSNGGGATYTHPVQRGRWVMDSFLCAAPGAPPPGIPSIDGVTGMTMRERLQKHTTATACQSCHKVMDLYGLGLENFDMTGRWRTVYADTGAAIDASGKLPDGSTVTKPREYIAHLSGDPAVQACLTEKFMSYALQRPLGAAADKCVARSVGSEQVKPTSTFSDFIAQIALTLQFREQAGAQP